MLSKNKTKTRTNIPNTIFVGTLPPPITGMTLITKAFVQGLNNVACLKYINISHRTHNRGMGWRFIKAVLSLSAGFQLLITPTSENTAIYLVANSNYGLFYTLLICAVARLKNNRIFLHHHVYSYIIHKDWKMFLVDRMLGERGTHIMLCTNMEEQFKKHYKSRSCFFVLSNSFSLSNNMSVDESFLDKTFVTIVLGHISNLSIEKGLDLVIRTFEKLLSNGANVQLILAGPTKSEREKKMILSIKKKYPTIVEYWGVVSGTRKDVFFRSVDVMLFPSRNEAQPMVVLEALSYSIPTIAIRRGCIPDMLGQGGVIIDRDDDYVFNASAIVMKWIKNPEDLAIYKQQAHVRWRELEIEGKKSLQNLHKRIISMVSTDV